MSILAFSAISSFKQQHLLYEIRLHMIQAASPASLQFAFNIANSNNVMGVVCKDLLGSSETFWLDLPTWSAVCAHEGARRAVARNGYLLSRIFPYDSSTDWNLNAGLLFSEIVDLDYEVFFTPQIILADSAAVGAVILSEDAMNAVSNHPVLRDLFVNSTTLRNFVITHQKPTIDHDMVATKLLAARAGFDVNSLNQIRHLLGIHGSDCLEVDDAYTTLALGSYETRRVILTGNDPDYGSEIWDGFWANSEKSTIIRGERFWRAWMRHNGESSNSAQLAEAWFDMTDYDNFEISQYHAYATHSWITRVLGQSFQTGVAVTWFDHLGSTAAVWTRPASGDLTDMVGDCWIRLGASTLNYCNRCSYAYNHTTGRQFRTFQASYESSRFQAFAQPKAMLIEDE